ncbi:DUF6194 family protein [Allohahella marinimesophila]|uniref:DUF6194 family protein n=1 Tax=Allohahella marinimesophila TaxID=1054972 RepID=A0ABP7PII2_9GAMM
MQIKELSEYILERYQGLNAVDAWGETSFFYNPEGRLPRGVYFATLKNKDGENDKGSELERDGVFRLNFGVSQSSYEEALGARPARPAAGGVVGTGHDFTKLNTLMPHPVYGWMAWVCILNPDQATWQNLQPLLNESYELAVKKYKQRVKDRR